MNMRLIVLGMLLVLLNAPGLAAQVRGAYHDDRGEHYSAMPAKKPKLLHASTADCPEGSEHLKQVVTLQATVGSDGTVTDVKLISAQASPVDEAAIEAVRKSTFAPATLNGKQVQGNAMVWVAFRGDGSPGVILEKVERPPVPMYTPDPAYTEEARENHFRGEVMVRVLVTADGKAADVAAWSPVPYGMDNEAVKAVREFTFKPATQNDVPVPMQMTIAVNFR
jgi:TonB family protein